MAYTSEIDKLEQRYRENPKGRNFAPLADAYRKAGLLDNAIELCKSGLERHPDYVSAHIVYGRCFIDQKNETAAAEVLRKVITLDPENVLALRMLAEIAQRGSRFDEAVEWLTKLLSADPMNGEAAEALSRMRSKAAETAARPAEPPPTAQKVEPVRKAPSPPSPMSPPPSPPSPPSPPAPPLQHVPPRPGAATPPIPMPDFVVEHAAEEPVAPELKAPAPPAGDIEVFDGTLDFNAAAHGTAKAEGLEVLEEVQLKAQDLVVEGLAHTPFESVLGPPPEPEQDVPAVDLPLIMPDEVTEATPSSSAKEGAAAASRGVVSAAPPPPLPVPPAPAAPPPMPAAVALSDDDGAADAAALSRAEPVLTETMAELYLRQGHPEDALRVYQALLVQRPQDARLRARVDALTPGGRRDVGGPAGESLPAFLKRILSGRSQATEPPVAVSPLESAFAVAALEYEAQPEIEAPGEATRPAEDTISLDQVFGEEEGAGGGGAARGSLSATESGPARAASPPPPAAAEPTPATGGFSFDQFFSPPVAIVEASAGPGLTPAPRVSGPMARPPAEDEGDLDQFQAWLKGLKS